MELAGQNIIVTGAARGIGLGITKTALAQGARVIMVDADGEELHRVAEELGADRVLPMVGSVSDPNLAAATVAAAVNTFGAVHGLVNNAGIVRTAMLEKMTIQEWQEVIDVHLTGSFLFLQAVCKHMMQRFSDGDKTPGSIVNISSDTGRGGTIGQINYTAAKAGVLGLTMSGAREMARYGIRVNTILFGMVETQMTEVIRSEKFRDRYLAEIPLGRWSTPEEVAKPICFLLSSGASYITGQHISVNGGRRITV
jgi:3-oxoacyl-[acyl-carrier protein] reductase